jgi:tetratricopeptide (TPR) repeat protein
MAKKFLKFKKKNKEIEATESTIDFLEIFQNALKYEPDNKRILMALGALYLKDQDINKAIQTYEKILKLSPDDINVCKILIKLYNKIGLFDARMISICLKAQESAPDDPDIKSFLAKIYLKQGKIEEAEKLCEEVLKNYPYDVNSLEVKAEIFYLKNKLEESEKIYKMLLLEKPDDEEILFNLAKIQKAKKNLDDAIVIFQETLKNPKLSFESLNMLGQCFFEKDFIDVAIRRLKKAIEVKKITDDLKETYYFLGRCYEKEGDLKSAKEMYREVVLLHYNFLDAKERFEKLSRPEKTWLDEAITSEYRKGEFLGLEERARARYRILSEIGRGGMGIVYKAEDVYLERIVAMKILPEELNSNPEAVKRFIQEARLAASLTHQNIVNIYDVGEEIGRRYISMEYVEGGNLRDKIEKEEIHIDVIIKIMKEVCEALNFAHSKGVIHRDIKPDNILLTKDGRVKITDFGIARMFGAQADITKTKIIGTPIYMSPEQIKGEEIDERSDIYSFGIMFYETITKKPPFSKGDIRYQHLNVTPEPPSKIRQDIPEKIEEIIMKCLAKNKEQRYQNFNEILENLGLLQKLDRLEFL